MEEGKRYPINGCVHVWYTTDENGKRYITKVVPHISPKALNDLPEDEGIIHFKKDNILSIQEFIDTHPNDVGEINRVIRKEDKHSN